MNLGNKHILVIDDEPSIHTFLRISLEALGAHFHSALTAAGGMALCETTPPDLILLDLSLPDNEGLNILPRIKRVNKENPLPVIVLTANKEQDVLTMAMQLGADAYITKPFILDDLLQVIYEQLHVWNTKRMVQA